MENVKNENRKKEKVTFSIITVCFNAIDTIEATIESVLSQSYDCYEYIIVDGASVDGTRDRIERYASGDSRIKFLSEQDDGLYYAMNKGIAMSSGEYLEFLNAGDSFVDSKVLEKVAEHIAEGNADIYYGNIIYKYPDGHMSQRLYPQWCSWNIYYLLGDCINHQSIFAHRRCFADDKCFDVSYKICADREWMIRMKKGGTRFRAIGELICYYSLCEDSQSISNEKVLWNEIKVMTKKHYPYGYFVYRIIDGIRNSKHLSVMMHKLYEMVFLKK